MPARSPRSTIASSPFSGTSVTWWSTSVRNSSAPPCGPPRSGGSGGSRRRASPPAAATAPPCWSAAGAAARARPPRTSSAPSCTVSSWPILSLSLRSGHTVENRLNGLVQLAGRALQLVALAFEIGAVLDPPIRSWFTSRVNSAQNSLNSSGSIRCVRKPLRIDASSASASRRMDVDPVVAGALVARRGAAEQVLRDHRIEPPPQQPHFTRPANRCLGRRCVC